MAEVNPRCRLRANPASAPRRISKGKPYAATDGETRDGLRALRRSPRCANGRLKGQGLAWRMARGPVLTPSRHARTADGWGAHFRLSASTAAMAASGTTVAHEPITAVVVAIAHRIETRCSIMPTSFDCE